MRFYDTSSLLNIFDKIFDEPFVISYISIAELEHIKISSNKDENIKCRARQITRLLTKNIGKYDVYMKGQDKCLELVWDGSNDSIILCGAIECSQRQDIVFVTDDLLLRLRAVHSGLKVTSSDEILESSGEYIGYKTVVMSTDDMSEFYTYPDRNPFGCLVNEYLLIKNTSGEIVDKRRWTGEVFAELFKKNIKTLTFGDKIKPKDVYQQMAIDSIMNNTLTAIAGAPGTGKTFIGLVCATYLIESGKYDRIVALFNPTSVRGAAQMGYYSGSMIEKFCQSALGNILISKFGSRYAVDDLIFQNKLRMVSMADQRGMEVASNEILWISESQNTSTDLIKLSISRLAEGAKAIIEGDYECQVDNKAFENESNGLKRVIDVFKGNEIFGYVDLPNVYRSKIAQLAEML